MSKIKAQAAVSLLGFLLFLGGCKDSKQEQELYSDDLAAPEQANYVTVQTAKGEYEKSASGDASLYYPVETELFWEEENARFREVMVTRGQEVQKGDVLMTFDIEVSNADREELSLKLTRLTEDTATGKAQRLSAIDDAKTAAEGLSGHELQIALLKVEKLQAEYEEFAYKSEQQAAEYRERIAELESKIENNMLAAPFDGVIDYVISFNIGDLVETDQALIEMHATDQYYLSVKDTAGNLSYNTQVTIEAVKNKAGISYEGRVVTAYNVLSTSVPEGRVLIKLYEDVPAEELDGNLEYQCNIEELQNVLLIDRKAVNNEEKKSYVYILEDDMIQKRYIVSGLSNKDTVWVVDGLSEGQNVIVD